MKLGALILQLYKSLGEELPNRVNWLEKIFSANIPIIQGYIEQTENYTVELKHILESNGWFRSRQTHPAWEKIEYNFSNEVVLFLHNNPLINEWELHVAFFAPWPTDWNASVKFGYLKALGFEPKFDEIDLYWGRPVCILRITRWIAEISRWQPNLLNDKFLTILASVLKELPEGHLYNNPKSFRESGWYGHDAVESIARVQERTWKESDPLYLPSWRSEVHKVVMDTNVSYVLFSSGSGPFESRAFDSAEEVAAEAVRLNRGGTYEDWLRSARNTPIIHDLRRENIHNAILYCTELKLGKALTPEKARVVQGFYRFLAALIKSDDKSRDELDAFMKATFKKFRLKLDEEGDWRNTIFYATDLTFGETYRDKVRTKPPEKISTLRKRKLAGRYVSKLAMIACIAGTDKLSVHEIIERFRGYPNRMEETAA